MRSIHSTVLSLSLLAIVPGVAALRTPDPASIEAQDEDELDPDEWSEVVTFEFPDGLVRAPEGQGAMGASALGVLLGKVQGTVLVDRRHGDQVAVFLGWSPPLKYAEDAHEDLRVRFRDSDGEAHVRERSAGGACGAQFTSPEDVELAKLESFTLFVSNDAKWLKGK